MSKPLHPVFQRLLRRAYKNGLSNLEYISEKSLPSVAKIPMTKESGVNVKSFQVTPTLTCKLFSLEKQKSCQPLLLHFPASGWIFDRSADNEAFCHYLATKLEHKILLPELILAPQRQFLGQLEDVMALYDWLQVNADNINIDLSSIDAWGESSGGHLLACLSHHLKQQGKAALRHQLLAYPILDLSSDYPSKENYKNGYLLDADLLQHMFCQMVDPEINWNDPLISPCLQNDFINLPKTTVITAEHDPVRDEALHYVEKLKQARVTVTHQQFDGMIHGFLRYAHKLPEANAALTFACEALKN